MRNWPVRLLTVAGVCSCLVAFGPARGHAETGEAGLPGPSQITEVRLVHADSMAVTQQAGAPQVFQGHVDVIVVDRERREARLKATKITILTVAGTKDVDRIVAEGRVVMKREGLTAKSELAVYDGRQGTVDLLQDNFLEDSRGQLTADRIRIYLESNRASADGNVRGIIFPQQVDASPDEQ